MSNQGSILPGKEGRLMIATQTGDHLLFCLLSISSSFWDCVLGHSWSNIWFKRELCFLNLTQLPDGVLVAGQEAGTSQANQSTIVPGNSN